MKEYNWDKRFTKGFEVSSVSRADLTEFISPEDADKFSDDEMKEIARKMGDNFCDCCYWVSLEEAIKWVKED